MEIKPGYELTEVGVIPEDWEVADLESITDAKRPISYGIVQTGPNIPNGVRCLRVVDLNDGRINRANLITTSRTISDSYQRTILNVGDLVMPLRGKVGDVAIVDEELAGSNLTRGVALIAIRSDWSAPYCRQFIASQATRNRLEQSMNGSALQEIPIATLRSFKIALPPSKAEQEAIAEALSDADALIKSLEQLIAKKRHLKQGAMQELLTGKRRLPGFANVTKAYKQTEIGVIPEDWETRSLAEGVRLLSGQHVLARHCNTDGDGVPYVTGPADFPKGVIQHTKFTTKPGTICRSNDVLVTVKGSGAGTLVLPNADYCISRQLMAIRVTEWNTNYIYFSLLRDASLFNAAATGLIPGLSRNDILNKTIPMPPTKTEQNAIAAILADMDAEIAASEAKLAKARQIKQGMMHNLLTGKIRLV